MHELGTLRKRLLSAKRDVRSAKLIYHTAVRASCVLSSLWTSSILLLRSNRLHINTRFHQSCSTSFLFFPQIPGLFGARHRAGRWACAAECASAVHASTPSSVPWGCRNLLTSVPVPFCSSPSFTGTLEHSDEALMWLFPSSDCRNCHYTA